MVIVQEVDRNELLRRFQSNPQFHYIQFALSKPHCYAGYVDKDEFERLLLNSSPKNPHPPFEEYPTVREVIEQIEQNLDFLHSMPQGEELNGVWVEQLCKQFRQNMMKPKDCFVIDKLQGMNKAGSFYIIDGIHRLVAYALATEMTDKYFPIPVYYCSG